MTKRLVDLDDDLLDEARSVSGDGSITGTIVLALQELVRRQRALKYIQELQAGMSKDLDDPEVLKAAQR